MASRTPLSHSSPQINPVSHEDASRPSFGRGNFLRSFGFAFEGIFHVIHTQRNMRIHLSLTAMALFLGFVFHISLEQWAILALTIMSVLVAEMFNTVVEAIVDLVSPNYHPLAKIAKDVAAGAVLVNAMFSVIIGLLIFGPRVWEWLIFGVGR